MSYKDDTRRFVVKENPIILGIETSCDETAVAITKGGREILADEIISSATEHAKFGGVVPEIASRAHTEAILTASEIALKHSGLSMGDIDAVAVTKGAGLLGALLVGVSFAKALAFSYDVPLVPVSHIRGHIAAAYLTDKYLQPPFITILASGGHTAIVKVKSFYEHEILGQTVDDAVGEAFDKVARVLGLKYPGGPNVERLALSGKNVIKLPKMLGNNYQGSEFDFSYSGLKTAVINYVHSETQKGKEIVGADVACSFQHAAIDVLIDKAFKALKISGYNTLAVSGGVGANGYLRETLKTRAEKVKIKLVLPEKRHCTDNAAMICAEGYLQYKAGNFADLSLNAQAVVEIL
ncbi:MAG: tRNA (adenosine(37)-N6)-threonylcarbamoyltransferase complex transferase subunit TsaD [Clostridia bacterium]|nr:tRNA (adenosine(37)-N6)-threonylcarbamoyltransferase complex transferase subunit TsaD [Clostridia bacterium]